MMLTAEEAVLWYYTFNVFSQCTKSFSSTINRAEVKGIAQFPIMCQIRHSLVYLRFLRWCRAGPRPICDIIKAFRPCKR